MHAFYKVVITINCLISLFFFGKWYWENLPRYELREGFVEDQICFEKSMFCDDFWVDGRFGRRKVGFYRCEKDGAGDSSYGICYIKEKVRVK